MKTNTDTQTSIEVHAMEAENDAAAEFGDMFDDGAGGDPAAGKSAKPAKPGKANKPPQPGEEMLELDDDDDDEPQRKAEPEEETLEEEAAEEEPEEEDDDEGEALKGARDPDKVNAMLQKRKDQRDAAIKERDTVLEELKTLREAQPAAPVLLAPTPQNPVSHIFRADDLQKQDALWSAELEWCQDNIEGGAHPGPDGRSEEWDAAKVKARMKQSLAVLKTHLPARERYLADFAADRALVAAKMPFLNPADAGYGDVVTWADAQLRKGPGIADHPEHVSLLGKAWIGQAVLDGKLVPVRQPDGSVKLVKVTGVSDGTGKPKTLAGQTPKPIIRKTTAPPVRKAGAKADLADVLQNGTPEEAAAAEMADLWDEAA